MSIKKLLRNVLIFGLIASSLAIWGANKRINQQTQNQLYTSLDAVPQQRVGLLLGTSQYLKSGRLNQYFAYRIQAAEELFKAGKISIILISGDNSRKGYNEPEDMKMALVARGIPADCIYLDYAGFRTYDSVYRTKAIFGQRQFVVISQAFHNQRAIYIANKLGLEAIGYNARDVDAYNGFKTNVREKLARVKVMLDLMLGKKPKFLGEPIELV